MKCYEGTIKVYINIDTNNIESFKRELQKMLNAFNGLAEIQNDNKKGIIGTELNIMDYSKKIEYSDLINLNMKNY